MKKEKHSSDKISEQTLHEILIEMKYSLNHIEDTMADDRALLIKLVKQNNSIVEWLKQIEIDEVTADYDNMTQPTLTEEEIKKARKFETLKEILDEFMSKRKELQEFEEELQKHKDELTPGTIGES